jgi:hypothetical protein
VRSRSQALKQGSRSAAEGQHNFRSLPRTAVLIVALSLGSLLVGACKQDLGERCEQGTDCYSGYCTISTVSAMGGVCIPSPTAGPASDAGTTYAPDAASESMDLGDVSTSSEGGGEVSLLDGALEVWIDVGAGDAD